MQSLFTSDNYISECDAKEIMNNTTDLLKVKKGQRSCISVNGTPSQRYGVSLATQCYLPPDTNEHTCLNPSHAGQYSIYLPWRDGGLS